MSLRVAVLRGGFSREAEVSAVSAREVAAGLVQAGHDVRIIDLDSGLTTNLLDFAPDVVFPALHGAPGEDGTVQGYLEMLGLPYVGAGVHGSAAAMDKSLAKAVFRANSLPVADEVVVPHDMPVDAAVAAVVDRLGTRVAIKPLAQGSALGVNLLPNGGDVAAALADCRRAGGDALVEPYVMGREMTVGVLDLHGEASRSLPVIEIRTAASQWYDFTNRYTPGRSEHILPASVSTATAARMGEVALRAHHALRLRDLSRADFIVTDTEDFVLLEVNTLPGMTPTSLYPDGANAIGYPFPRLVDALVRSALARKSAAR
ncbi:MAG: D-alanine--D-alanine ligase [Pseudomonadales bacterium]